MSTAIRDQWLTLDDSNGNIFDLTPHFTEINSAFEQHGWPDFFTYDLYNITHEPLPDTNVDMVPYTVSVKLDQGRYTAPPQSVTLEYYIGQSQGSDPMTHVGSGNYQGVIPAVTSPMVIKYRVKVVAQGPQFVQHLPSKTDTDSYFQFYVGETQPMYFNDFEGSGDHGWTHGFTQFEDDWERGEPQGKSGVSVGAIWKDPSSAVSGAKIWANDLGLPGYNGAYSPTVGNYLTSPVIDAQGETGLRLRAWIWLSAAEYSGTSGDQLRIVGAPVNGTPTVIFSNGSIAGDLRGGPWQIHEYDIGWADDSEFQIRFETNTNFNKNFGGWAIDNFEILALRQSQSGGQQTPLLRGNTAVSVGDVQVYEISAAPPDEAFEIRAATAPHGQYTPTPATGTTDASGNATASLPPAPSQYAGSTRYLKAFFQTTPVQSSNYCPLEVFP